MERTFLLLASINGFVAVALGAFGAHGLKGLMASLADGAQRLAWWETASRYHLAHALALGLLAVLAGRLPESSALQASGWAMQAGIVLFSHIVSYSYLPPLPWFVLANMAVCGEWHLKRRAAVVGGKPRSAS